MSGSSRGNYRSRGKGRGYQNRAFNNNNTNRAMLEGGGNGVLQYPTGFYPNMPTYGPMPMDNQYNFVPVGYPINPYYGSCDPNCQECQSYYANGIMPHYYQYVLHFVPMPLGATHDGENATCVPSPVAAVTPINPSLPPQPPQPPPPQTQNFPLNMNLNSANPNITE